MTSISEAGTYPVDDRELRCVYRNVESQQVTITAIVSWPREGVERVTAIEIHDLETMWLMGDIDLTSYVEFTDTSEPDLIDACTTIAAEYFHVDLRNDGENGAGDSYAADNRVWWIVNLYPADKETTPDDHVRDEV